MKKETKKPKTFSLRDKLILSLILFIGLLLRLYKINIPLADFHSWRQADTAAVARNFAREEFNLLVPKYDDLSNIQSGRENPNGYRMVEFPLYNAFFAGLYKYFPVISLEIYGRLTSVFFSLITIAVIYFLLLKEVNRVAAIIGSTIFAAFPFFVFFSRVILPEATALSLTFLSLLFLYLFSSEKNKVKNSLYYTLSLLLFAAALLIKPTVVFFGLSHLYLFIKKYGLGVAKKASFYFFFILTVLPLLMWRYYIVRFPEGIPASEWLISSVNTPEGLQNIFFRPAFFRWIFFERINNLILGGYLTFFFLLGALTRRRTLFLHSILLSSLAYLFTFQGGNVQHEYYQTLILPALAIFVAVGANFIFQNQKLFTYLPITLIVVVTIFLFSFLVSYLRVKDYYNYPKDLVSISNIVRDLTADEDKIVTDTLGDTTLLYLSNRKGAPSVFKDLNDLKKDGYSYFVTLNRDVIESTKSSNTFLLLFENEKFAIFKL